MNQGRMLATLTGAPHEDAWMWWRDVHHSIDLPEQPSPPPRAPSRNTGVDAVRRGTVAIVAEHQGEQRATSQHGEHVHGSGVVWDAGRGLVLTSDHVVENAGGIDVTVDAGPVTHARVLARAECNDLAVLTLERKPAQLIAIRPGDSGQLQAGDQVTAVGYLKPAAAAEPTYIATHGAVSAADVSFKLFPNQPDLASTVLHQAPTPPQMTGGPLVNQRGELVGLLTVPPDASSAPSLQVAISSDYLKERLAQLDTAARGAPAAWREEHACRDQMRTLEKGALVSHGTPEEHHHGG
jgi:S1-C subfamily serine protease